MRRIKQLLTATTAVGQVQVANVAAETASVPSLVISQLKITSSNGQFITLYNATNTALDMSKYQLEYFNSYDLAKATSSKLISLTGTVPPHGYFMVNDSALLLCYQLTMDSVSLGLSSTAGMVEVLSYSQINPGSSATPLLQDYVGWSKTAASGAQTLPSNTNAFLQRLPADSSNNPIVNTPGVGSWQSVQPSSSNACNLVGSSSSAPAQSGLSQLLPGTEPPAISANKKISPKKATVKAAKSKAKTATTKKVKKAKATTTLASSTGAAPATTTPIRTSTLAVVVGLALLYGAYEYRADLANRFHQLKRNARFGGGRGR